MIRQKLPIDKGRREHLRTKGQFWTPPWIADPMVRYVMGNGAKQIFDPAVGAGAFFDAVVSTHGSTDLSGMDVDAEIIPTRYRKFVKMGDFLLSDLPKQDCIVCNPPYLRHHRLNQDYKENVNKYCSEIIGNNIDGRAGAHVYFLIKSLSLLNKGGRLSFIVPSDTCEGKFSNVLWDWISANFAIEYAVSFDEHASPFEADTNPIIFMIRNTRSNNSLTKIYCVKGGTPDLDACIRGKNYGQGIEVSVNNLADSVTMGLSRRGEQTRGIRLGDFAKVVRGIATGANQFFHLTLQDAIRLGIVEFTVPAINRTRDVSEPVFTKKHLERLDIAGRPTRLLYLGNDHKNKKLDLYICNGERSGVSKRPLVATRNPWYRMEKRDPPDMLFTYLGRRNNRFILNRAKVLPLNTFHCVYAKNTNMVPDLFRALNDPRTIKNMPYVAKSYGFGALKIEPRSLEDLVIPSDVVAENDLA